MKTVFIITKHIYCRDSMFRHEEIMDIYDTVEKAQENAEKYSKLFKSREKQTALKILGTDTVTFDITEMEVK